MQPSSQFVDDLDVAAVEELDARAGVGDHPRGDSFDRFLARGVDRRDEGEVGLGQRFAELAREVARPRVEVRLEEGHDAPLRIAVSRRRERGPDLRRMVRVVVDDERAGVVAEDLEAPVDAEELCQRARRDVRREAELARDRDRRQGVADVVLAGNEELEEADAGNLEGGAAMLVMDVDGCEVCIFFKAVRNHAAPHAAQQPHHGGIVGAADDHASLPYARGEDAEGVLDGLEAAVVLEVDRLDVRDNGDLRMELVEGTVVLVGLDDDDVAAAALGVAAKVAEHAADEDGGIEPGLLEDGGDHRGGRGLAVRAGHADAALLVDDLAEELLALHDPDAAGAGGVDLLVLRPDRAGDDDEVDAVEVGGGVAEGDRDAALAEEVGGGGALQVAAGDGHALAAQDLSNATHPDAADADEMNVLNVFKIHSVCGSAYCRSIFSSKSTMF